MSEHFDCQPPVCPATASDQSSVFLRVRVLPGVPYGTRVDWTLHPNFNPSGPCTYQLEVGQTGLAHAEDWEPVGSPVVDPPYLIDEWQRDFGKTPWAHYRVVLTTPRGQVYRSQPADSLGDLDFRSWRLLKVLWMDEVRRWRTQPAGVPIWILKRKRSGQRCLRCLDYQSHEVLQPHCPVCFGVGIVGGYFSPPECQWMELDRGRSSAEALDSELRGPSDLAEPMVARMIAYPQIAAKDLIVTANSGDRYEVLAASTGAALRGVPVIYYPVHLALLPRSDPRYLYPIESQFRALSR